jgi:hypothetical protein
VARYGNFISPAALTRAVFTEHLARNWPGENCLMNIIIREQAGHG